MTYRIFAKIISFFPLVRVVALKNHPINDIYLTILLMLAGKVQQVHLLTCWLYPMRKKRINAQLSLIKLWRSKLEKIPQMKSQTRHLHELIERLTSNQSQPVGLSEVGYRLLASCSLTHLSLTNCGLTDHLAGILLRELTNVRYLNISNNDQIEGQCFLHLGK